MARNEEERRFIHNLVILKTYPFLVTQRPPSGIARKRAGRPLHLRVHALFLQPLNPAARTVPPDAAATATLRTPLLPPKRSGHRRGHALAEGTETYRRSRPA